MPRELGISAHKSGSSPESERSKIREKGEAVSEGEARAEREPGRLSLASRGEEATTQATTVEGSWMVYSQAAGSLDTAGFPCPAAAFTGAHPPGPQLTGLQQLKRKQPFWHSWRTLFPGFPRKQHYLSMIGALLFKKQRSISLVLST